jgi:hypothetical protein
MRFSRSHFSSAFSIKGAGNSFRQPPPSASDDPNGVAEKQTTRARQIRDRDFRRGVQKQGASDNKLVPHAHPEGLLRISGGQQPGVGPAVRSDIEVAWPSMNDDVGNQQTGERQRGYHA